MDVLESRRAVSTWSLHRTLGNFVSADSAVEGGPCLNTPLLPGGSSLLDLLPEIANRGYRMLQICHFHLESRDAEYLHRLRDGMEASGIKLEMLLIDAGDLMADDIKRQLSWYHGWLDVAETLGAERGRICAGRSAPTPARMAVSGRLLAQLAAEHPNVRIVTENWLEATPDAESLLTILDTAGDSVGLLIDLGNWSAPEKYAELEKIAPRAESCHAKCHVTADGLDDADFRRGLSILQLAGYSGPLSLIYDGPDPDEWKNLDAEWQLVVDTLS